LSHLKERSEKNCLNCNAQVMGRYCHICGQENIEPKETVWHLITHFFEDITHFDGKFFSSLKLLVTRPGFLSREYMLGRRASYLNPIRMYVFTSAFFFLIFFSFLKISKDEIITATTVNGKTSQQIEQMDSVAFDAFTKNVNKEDGKPAVPMTREAFKKYLDSSISTSGIHLGTTEKFKSKEEYDSLLKVGARKDNWWVRQLIYRQIAISKKYKNDSGETITAFNEILLHSLPQMFFISLPLFALLLKLLYFRRKQFYYVSHGIFSIHFYIFIFIAMLVMFGLGKMNEGLHWKIITITEVVLGCSLLFYLYKAMRNFYQQRRAKTIFKFLLLCFSFFIVLTLLFIVFVFFSLFKL
jgi:hypothetical protein